MNRKFFLSLLYFCISAIPTFGQQENYVFDEGILSVYDDALRLNEAKDYLKAYRQILRAEQAADSAISSRHIQVESLSDDEFEYPYWRLMKTKAEIAYMLGIHSVIEEVSDELKYSLVQKHWTNEDRQQILSDRTIRLGGSRY